MEPAGACAAYEGCGFFPVWMWGSNPIPYFLPRMSRNPAIESEEILRDRDFPVLVWYFTTG